MSVSEDPRPGRPSTSTNNDHVSRVRAVIRGNRRLTVREVGDEVGISIGSCHKIFNEKLQIRPVSAKFVPRLLTDDQKEDCVEISQELLANANGNANFLKNIITGDETWVYEYDVETRMQSSQWRGKGLYKTTVQPFCHSQYIAMLSSSMYEYRDGHVHNNMEQPVGLARYYGA